VEALVEATEPDNASAIIHAAQYPGGHIQKHTRHMSGAQAYHVVFHPETEATVAVFPRREALGNSSAPGGFQGVQ
jgi:hypothetical protein